MSARLKFLLNSGKNPKWKYYLRAYSRLMIPAAICQRQLPHLIEEAKARPDYDHIRQRVDYYCRLNASDRFPTGDFPCISQLAMTSQKVYYLDTIEYLRYFPPTLKARLLPGDITYVPTLPQIVKSRPIADDNANGILLKLDKVRHFIFVSHDRPFASKKDKVQFRGKIGRPNPNEFKKKQRWELLNKYWGHPLCDLGEIASHGTDHNEAWLKPKLTISEQLENKFIFCIEGNDVASNLKWVMSSNSVAVMPRPTCETWFMEATLRPDYHYIEVRPDFADMPDKIQHYIDHPQEALAIIEHAHEYVNQFRDAHREDLIALLTLDKYLRIVNHD